MEDQPPIWTVAVNIFNKQFQTADRWWSSRRGDGEGAKTLHHKNWSCYIMFTIASGLD